MSLDQLLATAGMDRAGLAQTLGVSLDRVHGWANGEHTPAEKLLSIIAHTLCVPIPVVVDTIWPDHPDTLRFLRLNQGYTRDQLANRIGVDKALVVNWETGKSVPRPAAFLDLADQLHVSTTTLLGAMNQTRHIGDPDEPTVAVLLLLHGLTKTDLAKRLGVSNGSLSHWLRDPDSYRPGDFPSAVENATGIPAKAMADAIHRTTPTSRRGITITSPHPFLKARQDAGLTRAQMAQRIGTSVSTLSGWERGGTRPPYRYIPRIARALDIPEATAVTLFPGITPTHPLKQMRDVVGLNGRQIADAMGVSTSIVSQWERGQTPMPPERIVEYGRLIVQTALDQMSGQQESPPPLTGWGAGSETPTRRG